MEGVYKQIESPAIVASTDFVINITPVIAVVWTRFTLSKIQKDTNMLLTLS